MPKKKQNLSIASSSHLPTALVAGAAGFVGSHLCEALIHQNCKVYGIDNWTTGNKQNLKSLLKNDNFVFIEHDLNKKLSSPVPRVDYVFHLAGIEAYVNGLDVSLETLLVNSLGARELLEIAKEKKAKYLLASTTDIFSGFLSSTDLTHYFGSSHHQEEAYSHHEAKRFSEALTFEYVNRYQLDARVVRLGNIYGARMDLASGSSLASLFRSFKKEQALKIPGQGLAQLYPTYISDVVYGLIKAMFSQSSSGQIFTLVNPQKTTLLNFAYAIKEVSQKKDTQLEFTSSDHQDPIITLSEEILESQKQLGWTPKVTVKEGIAQTLDWLKTGKDVVIKSDPEDLNAEDLNKKYTAEELGLKPAQPPTLQKKELNLSRGPALNFKLPKLSLPKIKLPSFSKPESFSKKSKTAISTPKVTKLELKPPTKKQPISFKNKILITVAGLLLLYILIPLFLTGIFAYSGANALKQASQLTSASDLEKLTELTSKAEKNFNFSRLALRRSQFIVKLFAGKALADNLDRMIFIGSKLSQGAFYLSQAGESGTFLSQIVFHHQDGNISQALKEIQINLDQAYNELSFVESDLQSGPQLDFDISTSLTQKIQQLTTDLPSIRQKINQVRSILPLIPSFIAEDSKKTYLLLFQNSAEIRPTGGFIGSYGLLTFDQGRLLDFSVEDIYSADGQLTGFVEPPAPIKEFLGQNTWYFRDSNWDPDFSISAQRAEWFLNKTTSRNVDGVIAINLPAVKELLKATGPIQLSDYNEEVNSENLFDRAEYRAEIDFFPGSTQKRDFLGSLAREIFDQAQNSQAGDLLKFSEALETSLTQKQILIYLHDENSQKILLAQNWAGTLFEPDLSSINNLPVTSDYNYLVEANLGINKANYFLQRNINHQLTLLKNKEILTTTTITYNNQSPADAWPGGTYRSYLRDYIPLGSKLVSIKIDGSNLNLEKEVDQEVAQGKLVVGFPVTVPVKNTVDVKITYRLQDPLSLVNNSGRLAIVIPKQPGITQDTLEVVVNHPSYLNVISSKPQAFISPQVVTYQSNLDQDRVFTVDFIEK